MTTETKETSQNDEATAAPSSSHCYAVFIQPRRKNRAVDPPCLDPLDFGQGNEPYQNQLLRRGRVGLFTSKAEAEREIKRTCELNYGADFLKDNAFLILECVNRSEGDFCEHGIADGEWCEPCNHEYKEAAEANR